MDTIKIFIVPRGRTGGTLFATMLDAHPGLKMGYEIYPDRLCDKSEVGYKLSFVISMLEESRQGDSLAWMKAMPRENFRIFCARARRSGLEPECILEELLRFKKIGGNFGNMEGRLNFIDRLLDVQRLQAGKSFSGSKMRVDPFVLHKRHPDTAYYMMLRDGRDVLDSRLKVGNFQTSAEECARDWLKSLEEFEHFLDQSGVRGCLVRYEELVYKPEETLREVLSHSSLDFHQDMIAYLEKYPALFNAPHGHLSVKRIAEGLNDRTIGRWKKGLNSKDLDTFMSIAGRAMKRYGY